MCRVAMVNGRAIRTFGWRAIHELFDYLEASQGGHGNGIAVLRSNGKIHIKKGIFAVHELIDWAYQYKDDIRWMLFHTRLASVGKVSPENCHPFKNGSLVAAMNGHLSEYANAASMLGMTDTEFLIKSVDWEGLWSKYRMHPANFLKNFPSVFMGFWRRAPFVTCGDGYETDLALLYMHKKGAMIFASEFPTDLRQFALYPIKAGIAWTPYIGINPSEWIDYDQYRERLRRQYRGWGWGWGRYSRAALRCLADTDEGYSRYSDVVNNALNNVSANNETKNETKAIVVVGSDGAQNAGNTEAKNSDEEWESC